MKKIKIAIVDDHPLLRKAINMVLEEEPNIETRFEASDGQELIESLERGDLVDIILIDFSMPVMDGITATKIIKKRWKNIAVVAFTMHNTTEMVKRFFDYGGDYYLPKVSSSDQLIETIRKAAASILYK